MGYRYLGNKTRIREWIVRTIADRVPAGATVADPMCGTAAVSAALADKGFRVIASDQLKFPVLHAQARLLHDGSLNFRVAAESYEGAIQALNELEPVKGLFWREYSDLGSPANGSRPRKYLTGANAARVDAIRMQVRKWRDEGLEPRAADLLLHDLILAVNRVANIAGTYGYYRSSWTKGSLGELRLRCSELKAYAEQHRVMHGSADEVLSKIKPDAVYLDPPYTKRQYGGNYHIPETLACEDEPEPIGEGGLRNWSAQASEFCYRRRAESAFISILETIKTGWVFISYSEDAHLPSCEMLSLLKQYGAVERHEHHLERFRSNGRVAREGSVKEHLYVVEMKHACATESNRGLVEAGHAE
jgi:adenine-specific DNA-methyltransferase